MPGTVELRACNSGIACQDPSPKCFWCSVHRFLCLEKLFSAPATVELPATLIFSFGSGVTFGPGRGKAGGCSVTPCQGVFLIRRVPSGLLSVPWNSGIRFRSDVWPGQRDGRRNVTPEPNEKIQGSGRQFHCSKAQKASQKTPFESGKHPGRGTAGGCSVTPCQGAFLIRRVSSGLLSVPWNKGVFLIRRVSSGLLSVPWNSGIACQQLDFFIRFRRDVWPGQRDGRRLFELPARTLIFPECVAKGSRLTLGGLGVEPCSRPVVSKFATVRNRSQPSATVRNRPQPFAVER